MSRLQKALSANQKVLLALLLSALAWTSTAQAETCKLDGATYFWLYASGDTNDTLYRYLYIEGQELYSVDNIEIERGGYFTASNGKRYRIGGMTDRNSDHQEVCGDFGPTYQSTQSETQQANCPATHPSGSITQQRTFEVWSDGSRRNYSGWNETGRNCQAVYNSTQTESRNQDCPATHPQGTITQQQTYEVWSDGSRRNDSGWRTTGNTCTAIYSSKGSESRQLSCPAATPSGTWTQSRSYDLYTDGSHRNESAWGDTSTCYNRTPIAGNLAIASDEDTPASGTLPVTDDHSTFTYQIVSAAPAAAGTARFAGNTVVITPTADWNGATSMTYRAQDPSGAWSNVATVSITIRPVNDAPIAEAKSLILDEDTQASVLLSATDIDSPAPTAFQLVAMPPAAVGQVTLAGATATFKPAKDWNGATQFTYRAQDTAGAWSAPAAVAVTVRPVNDEPVLTDVSLEIRTKESLPVTTRAVIIR
ncbi:MULTISPECIES: Ig-like domain-containing protein [Pseudomonas]|uniref:Tandem-95 repeat protein n=1 Tax=Pseudomonas oryzihabitans TaxID=47885 RepID=A0A178LKS2_9PSED|nr:MULTISPECIES: Ig-like domain-containing protein [Pseudomonas]NRH44498.1 tandem-95 repeat protein [Pseudomonas sp. MS15a(2019)]OAN31699.1 hypothetical protein A4V15_11600 [Pseudomonas oryzihabitans]